MSTGVRRSSRGTGRPTCRDRSGMLVHTFVLRASVVACGPHGLVGCGQVGQNFHVVGDL